MENAGAVVEDGDAASTAKSADRSSHYGNQCSAFSESQIENCHMTQLCCIWTRIPYGLCILLQWHLNTMFLAALFTSQEVESAQMLSTDGKLITKM